MEKVYILVSLNQLDDGFTSLRNICSIYKDKNVADKDCEKLMANNEHFKGLPNKPIFEVMEMNVTI